MPQMTMTRSSKDRDITFGVAIREASIGAFEIFPLKPLEPLGRELATHAEYGVGEQGTLVNRCWRMPELTF